MAKYYVVDDDHGAGCFTAIIIGVIVIAVLACFAMYALAIALGIILLISGVIGTVLTLRNYIVALKESISHYKYAKKPGNLHVPVFVYRWFKIAWETIKGSWRYNFACMKTFFGKVGFYRFFSFKKWICLFTGLSVLIFGTLISLFILFIHLCIAWIVLSILVSLLIFCGIVFGLIGMGLSIAFATTNYISCVSDSYSKSATILSAYTTQCGFSEYVNIIRQYWDQNITRIKSGFISFRGTSILSIKAWLGFAEGITLIITGGLFFAIYALIHIIIQTVLFIVFKIVSLFVR